MFEISSSRTTLDDTHYEIQFAGMGPSIISGIKVGFTGLVTGMRGYRLIHLQERDIGLSSH